MLLSLAIRDIVLIERLDLELGKGFLALTGETGAGKSIVLDALGLALGARADRSLVRAGAEQASVTAIFAGDGADAALALLQQQGLAAGDDGEIVLRRTLAGDGRARAFVNDQPVSAGLLRQLGGLLVEVHGQQEQQTLAAPQTQRRLLDAFAGAGEALATTREAHRRRQAAAAEVARQRELIRAAERERDLLFHREQELQDLAPQVGEEETLAEGRTRLMHRGKLIELLDETSAQLTQAVQRLGHAERRIERSMEMAQDLLEPAAIALSRAMVEAGEAEQAVNAALRSLQDGSESLEEVEERLFALRAMARKHRVPADELPQLLASSRAELQALDLAADRLATAESEAAAADARYRDAVAALSALRRAAALALATAVMAELPPLRLERAQFRIHLEPLPVEEQGAEGAERVVFEISTNPGQPFGPLTKLASGGELSRFMLALKVVIARLEEADTLVFDEVDAGVGGATAAAVGERLARLGAERQVLVVTHAPQVAAQARRQYRVSKSVQGERTFVAVEALSGAEREDEIARMLAGSDVTEAARAAAASLIREPGE